MQNVRNVGYPLRIRRDVVSHLPVTSGKGARETSVRVGQADGGAVEFKFAAIGELLAVQEFFRPGDELRYVFTRVCVRKREHRVFVRTLFESR